MDESTNVNSVEIRRAIAVRGTGAVCAAGAGRAALLDAVMRAVPLARTVTRYDTSDLVSPRAAQVPVAVWRELEARWPGRDPCVQLSLAAIDEALAGAVLPDDCALFVGTSVGSVPAWARWHGEYVATGASPYTPALVGHDDPAREIARELGLHGEVVTTSTACTSSTASVLQAMDALRLGEITCALVVGVDVLCRFVHAGFDRLGALAPPDRAPSPFGRDRAGMWLGEGAAAMLLVRDEGRDGVRIARVLGGATASDGVHMTAPDRHGLGMARTIRAALDDAGLEARAIDWVSAHATSTRYNDAMEHRALANVFGEAIPTVHAAKPVLGHTLGASGVLEAVLAIEALRRGVRMPTHTVPPLDPAFTGVQFDTEPVTLAMDGTERTVLSLSAALAGHDAALVLEVP